MEKEQRQWVLERAYVPEHVVGLMEGVSGGEAVLVRDFLGCRRAGWFGLVGYPLETPVSLEHLEAAIGEAEQTYGPRTLSVIAPQIPAALSSRCAESEQDRYYTLDLESFRMPGPLRRIVRKAAQRLDVRYGAAFDSPHRELADEFVRRARPGPRVKTLLDRMDAYLAATADALVIGAWTQDEKLSAFYVLDLAAPRFGVYVIGCHSRRHYVPGASDLVFAEMVRVCRDRAKEFVHLGLGVSPGIRRFKEKWGGRPGLCYQMCELVLKKPSFFDYLRAAR